MPVCPTVWSASLLGLSCAASSSAPLASCLSKLHGLPLCSQWASQRPLSQRSHLPPVVVMPNYAEYFEKNRYQSKYSIGDRVCGTWNKIPFVGTVGNDSEISPVEGPKVSIHLDLPIRFENQVHRVILVKHRQIRPLPLMDPETHKPKNVKPKT